MANDPISTLFDTMFTYTGGKVVAVFDLIAKTFADGGAVQAEIDRATAEEQALAQQASTLAGQVTTALAQLTELENDVAALQAAGG